MVENGPKELLSKLEPFYGQADTSLIACIDERPIDEQTNGVKTVGATDGVLDAYKIVTGATEEEARAAYEASGLPFGGHTDHHHGVKGCGYRNKVETAPELVGAPEAVAAENRYAWITSHPKAFAPVYSGEHKPVAAIINKKKGTTLYQSRSYPNGMGAFNLDVWHLNEMAEKLKVDPQKFTEAMTTLFKNTVEALAPGTPIIERT